MPDHTSRDARRIPSPRRSEPRPSYGRRLLFTLWLPLLLLSVACRWFVPPLSGPASSRPVGHDVTSPHTTTSDRASTTPSTATPHPTSTDRSPATTAPPPTALPRNLRTTDADAVAAYLHLYGELPPNYVTKDDALDAGWEPRAGNLREVMGDDAAIGGEYFGNYEGLLPDLPGSTWHAADVYYEGGHRGPDRLVWSDEGHIYYTDDHYASFRLIFDPDRDAAPQPIGVSPGE